MFLMRSALHMHETYIIRSHSVPVRHVIGNHVAHRRFMCDSFVVFLYSPVLVPHANKAAYCPGLFGLTHDTHLCILGRDWLHVLRGCVSSAQCTNGEAR
jgi:hypothetical protein